MHAVGLPVKEGGAVRGEFDFIVTLPGLPGIQHLETGYKFFLHAPTDVDESRCIGPNPADRLDRKWRHMVDAQLPLSQSRLGRAALPSSLANMPITPGACLQGYIFYPFGHDKPRLTKLAPDHAHGWWSRFDKAISRPRWTTLASAWTVLPKLRWIAPARVAKAESSPMSGDLCQARLAAHFSTRGKRSSGGLARDRDGHWHETVRVFGASFTPTGRPIQARTPIRARTDKRQGTASALARSTRHSIPSADPLENPVKQRLRQRRKRIWHDGVRILFAGNAADREVAGAEFIAVRHGAHGDRPRPVKQPVATAAESACRPSFAFPPDYHFIAHALDTGAVGVMVPMVETARASGIYRLCSRYPPDSSRGGVRFRARRLRSWR